MRGAVLDIETSDLAAVGAGVMLCAVIKPLEGKETVFRYDEMHCRVGHEKRLVAAVVNEMESYDLLVGHNIKNFDYGFIKSRALYFGITSVPRPFFYDTFQAFKRLGYRTRLNNFGKPSAGLAMVVDFFGIPQRKTSILPRQHWATVWESGKDREDAMKYLVQHCVDDVRMTEEIYWKLMRADFIGRLERLK